MCYPNVRQFGYYPTQWRKWPGPQRKDVTFPGSIGREAVPHGPGKKTEQLPIERIPQRPEPGLDDIPSPEDILGPEGQPGMPGGGLPGLDPSGLPGFNGGLPGGGLPSGGLPGLPADTDTPDSGQAPSDLQSPPDLDESELFEQPAEQPAPGEPAPLEPSPATPGGSTQQPRRNEAVPIAATQPAGPEPEHASGNQPATYEAPAMDAMPQGETGQAYSLPPVSSLPPVTDNPVRDGADAPIDGRIGNPMRNDVADAPFEAPVDPTYDQFPPPANGPYSEPLPYSESQSDPAPEADVAPLPDSATEAYGEPEPELNPVGVSDRRYKQSSGTDWISWIDQLNPRFKGPEIDGPVASAPLPGDPLPETLPSDGSGGSAPGVDATAGSQPMPSSWDHHDEGVPAYGESAPMPSPSTADWENITRGRHKPETSAPLVADRIDTAPLPTGSEACQAGFLDEVGEAMPGATVPVAAIEPLPGPQQGLNGFCPVTLCTEERWVEGCPEFTAEYHGHIYHFAGPQQRDQFYADPQRFSPQYDGLDPVLLLERRQHQPGLTRHCVTYEGRLYMFSSEKNLERFSRSPAEYTSLGH
jgi:YHS domain-containing protein